MEPLNTPNVLGDESGAGSSHQANPVLTWHWSTWTANLRRATITTVAVILFTATSVTSVWWIDQSFTKKLKTQTDLKNQAETKLRNSDQERSDIDNNISLLRQLESRGIFGVEKRLEWIEQLRAIEKRWAGMKLQYNISIQNPLPDKSTTSQPTVGLLSNQRAALVLLPSGEQAQSFGAFQTDMKLTLQVLHEGDVLALIEELKAANLGHFTVKRCSFKRPENTVAPLGASNASNSFVIGAPLDVECLLTWVSMKAYTP